MKRALAAALSLTVVAAVAGTVRAAAPATTQTGLLAGAAVVDATWHVGAGAGQYASEQDTSDPMRSEWDPNVQHVKNTSAYGIASRLSMRAIVLQSPGEAPVALVKTDNYLTQDMLVRRAAQLLEGTSQVRYENMLVSSTHDHNSPYYSTPAAGVWLFQDAMDLRMFEYQARAMAEAIRRAETRMQPATVGATTVDVPEFQGNIAGSDQSEDGTPAGYPLQDNDHGLTVLRIDALDGTPIATYANYAQHGESLDGYDLISADWIGPFERFVDRATGGAPLVFSQGAVGSTEGPYEHSYGGGPVPTTLDHGEPVYKVWAHGSFAQAERGGHLLADRVLAARSSITDLRSDAVVKMLTHWVAGPLSHPYPGVSNCRTRQTTDGDPGVVVAGLPDCARPSGELDTTPAQEFEKAFGQTFPARGLYDNLVDAGLPVPSSYDAASFGSVEENLRIKLQAVRIGEALLASCACEAQADLIRGLETRIDKAQGNRWDGFDFADPAHVAEGWPGLDVQPCFATATGQSCPDPRDRTGKRRVQMSQAAFDRMQAQIHNDADGWDDPAYVAQAQSEPSDPALIKGNFTARELPASCGYDVPVGLGHTGDYNGYTVSYREFMARDSYRKALTAYGPHTADYMVTHLMAMAQVLKCGGELPQDTTAGLALADEQRQAAEAVALGQLSSYYLDAWDAQVPDSAGPAAITAQPTDITRFQAATLHWVGGDNWTDNPTVVVQRKQADGSWQQYGDQNGEVQTALDQPAGIGEAAVDNRTGKQRWTWTASFEAFDSYPRSLVDGGQVPEGTYRFVVDGHIHQGKATPYRLVSREFSVSKWTGLTATRAGVASFRVAPVAYPRTYTSPIRFIRDDLGGVDAGAGDENGSVLCRTCSFRPWASTSEVVSVTVTVLDKTGHRVRTVAATRSGDTWTAPVRLGVGQTAVIEPGGLRDAYGETNGTRIS